MKVALVMDSISRQAGGLLEANRRVAQGLQARGDDVSVLGVQDAYTEADRESWSGVKTQSFACQGPRRFGYAPEMDAALRRVDADVLHTQGMWTYTSLVASRWRQRTGRPEIIHPHGMMDAWALKNSAWKKRLMAALFERRHLREASCLRALCQAELEAIRAYGLTNPVCVIPNGIDLPDFRQPGGPHPDLPAGKKVLLYLGRVHPKKGLENLVLAWSLLKAPGWILAIAGWDEGGHEALLKQRASECGIIWSDKTASPEDSVVFLGPRFGSDKERLYEGCDAFVLPSFSEGLPMVILEAWAYGKPVVMTPMCHLPEGVAAGAAIQVEPAVNSLIEGLRQMTVASDEERKRMGDCGRTLVREKFTWDQVTEQIASVQAWLLRGNARPACVFQ